MPTTNRRAGHARLSRLAVLGPAVVAAALALPGCGNKDKSSGDKQTAAPAAAPAGETVSANNTNKPYHAKPSSGTLGTVERLDPRLDALLAGDAKMEKLVEGLDWAEGPVWHRQKGVLFFSDVPQNVVYQWQEGKGVSEYLRPSGYTGTAPRGGEPGSNGLTIDPEGRLVLCQHGDRRVAVLGNAALPSDDRHWAAARSRGLNALAANYDGKRFNSPNDLCFDKAGNLYFTDPPYGLPKNVDDPTKEIPFQGVYRVGKDGKVVLLTKEMTRPNGIALSPDEKTLYVANSDPKQAIWKAFPIKDDGTLGEGKVFFDATKWVAPNVKGLPDGMKVDTKGNLWATGPGGVLVFAPDGTHLGTLKTGEATANVAFGGADGSTLYICADSYIARIPTKAKGW
ncbi:MAG TPA: SMP-30/gluconolactonase/LRE family protein [Humisphaera sp.]